MLTFEGVGSSSELRWFQSCYTLLSLSASSLSLFVMFMSTARRGSLAVSPRCMVALASSSRHTAAQSVRAIGCLCWFSFFELVAVHCFLIGDLIAPPTHRQKSERGPKRWGTTGQIRNLFLDENVNIILKY